MLISGYLIGKNAQKNGYVNGLLFGIITSIILFLFSLLFENTYTIGTLFYYLIIIILSTIGAMFGIQKKKN